MDKTMYIEVDNRQAKKTSVKQAIKDGYFMVWTPERMKKAFSNGHGTFEDFNRYKNDNKPYCVIIEMTVNELTELYPEYFYNNLSGGTI